VAFWDYLGSRLNVPRQRGVSFRSCRTLSAAAGTPPDTGLANSFADVT
jgi:hypothetical protein